MALPRRIRKTGITLEDGNISITSLMDVLTVLLFFLIKSFSVSTQALSPPQDVQLPLASQEENAEEAITVSLSPNEVRVNSQVLTKLKGGRFPASEIGEDGRTLQPLKRYLDLQMQKRNAVYKGEGDISFLPPGKVLIQAHKDLPYGLVKVLLHTSAITGYSDYQFVVQGSEKNGK